MGDDLIFAQKFTRTAADGLALLVEMGDPRASHESSVVIDMMTTMQRGAKRLRARNIYTGAQNVLSALHHKARATNGTWPVKRSISFCLSRHRMMRICYRASCAHLSRWRRFNRI